MATNNNNVWNDIQEDVKKLYVGQVIETEQIKEIKEIVGKLWKSYKAVKEGNMSNKTFYDYYAQKDIHGIRYLDIVNIISFAYGKRDERNKKKDQKQTDDLKQKNAPNKLWNLLQKKYKTDPTVASKIYQSGKTENAKEQQRINKIDNKDVHTEQIKKERLIEKYKGKLDKLFEISKKTEYKNFKISCIEACIIEKLKGKSMKNKKTKVYLNNYYHDNKINYYYFLLNDFEKFKKCVEKGVIILTLDYIPQHLVDNSQEQKEYLNYSKSKDIEITSGKLEGATKNLNIRSTNNKKVNNVQIKIYKNLRKVDPDHYRVQNEKEKERDQIFNLFIKVSLTGYKFEKCPKIEDFFYDKNENKYIYLNLNNLVPDETNDNFSNFKKKWNEFINDNNTQFLGFKKKDISEKYEMTPKTFKEKKEKMKNIKFSSYDLIIPASLATIVSGLLIGKNIKNLIKKSNESSKR
tara:strand:- start:752 stop:2140 length:1389 start_codon:yes stop_codon:yes gene_type:complete